MWIFICYLPSVVPFPHWGTVTVPMFTTKTFQPFLCYASLFIPRYPGHGQLSKFCTPNFTGLFSKMSEVFGLPRATPGVVTRRNVSVPSIREQGLPYVTETFFGMHLYHHNAMVFLIFIIFDLRVNEIGTWNMVIHILTMTTDFWYTTIKKFGACNIYFLIVVVVFESLKKKNIYSTNFNIVLYYYNVK